MTRDVFSRQRRRIQPPRRRHAATSLPPPCGPLPLVQLAVDLFEFGDQPLAPGIVDGDVSRGVASGRTVAARCRSAASSREQLLRGAASARRRVFAGLGAAAEREPRADAMITAGETERHVTRRRLCTGRFVAARSAWRPPPARDRSPAETACPFRHVISPTVENCGDDIDTEPTFSIATVTCSHRRRAMSAARRDSRGRAGAETRPAPT